MQTRSELHAVTIKGAGEPTLIFAHGLGTDQTSWAPQVEAFAGSHRVVTFDLAGSGAAHPSLWSASRHGSLLGFVDDLSMLVDELDLSGAVYIGHSLSGMAGALAVSADPGLFSGLVIIGGSACYIDDPANAYIGGFSRADVDNLIAAIEGDFYTWASGFAPVAMGNLETPHYAAEFARSLARYRPDIALCNFRTAFYGDHRKAVASVALPSLVLQSTDDIAVPLAAARWLADHVQGAILKQIDATGHFPYIVAPDQVTVAIAAFLDGLVAVKAA
jgi:sigma-B regulation protein RsbQ